MPAAAKPLPKFPVVVDSFHQLLRKKIQQYFADKKIEQSGNKILYTKATVFFTLFFGLYIHLVFFTPVWYIATTESLLLGAVIAGIGFNIMHDGGHGSFSNIKFVNTLAAFSANLLGVSQFMWNMKHNVLHHSFTNIVGADNDLEVRYLLRMAPEQKQYKIQRFQHFYFWALYMLLYVFWIFFTDYQKYFTQKIGNVPLKKMPLQTHIGFWAVKAIYLFTFIVLPIMLMGWLPWLIGYVIIAAVAGFTLSIVFQMAHTVEGTAFPTANEHNKLPDEFALHQIKTTANFSPKNKLITWFVGGLNYQVEHHLFPKISHVHYPAISKIIKQVCVEHQIKRIEYPTFLKALRAHVNFLKQMGTSKNMILHKM